MDLDNAYPILGRPLHELTLQDLRSLIGVEESDRIEFKREAYERNDEKTREMLRDITSLGNHVGGHLIIGVKEENDRAVEIRGIGNAQEEASRMLSSCRANIEENILGLDFTMVPVDEARSVLVWFVPRSTRAPHMITFKGLYQCWRRHGRQKDRMSIEEIREACNRTQSIRKGIEEFLKDRRRAILTRWGDVPLLYLSATPLLVEDEVLDIHDQTVRALLKHPPYQHQFGLGPGLEPRPSLHGVIVQASRASYELELWRNAHCELRMVLRQGPHFEERMFEPEHSPRNILWQQPLCALPLGFLNLARAIIEHTSLLEPVVMCLALYNIGGFGLIPAHPRAPFHSMYEARFWEGDHLEVPPMQLLPPLQPSRVAKHLADRLWNAFGIEFCPLLDENAGFKP